MSISTWNMFAGASSSDQDIIQIADAIFGFAKDDYQNARNFLSSKGRITDPYTADDFRQDKGIFKKRGAYKADAIAIADRWQLDCLGAVDRIEEAVPSKRSVFLIAPAVFSCGSDDEIKAAEVLMECRDVLYDCRTSDDFAPYEENLLAHKGIYTGAISSKVALGVQKHQLCRIVSTALDKMSHTVSNHTYEYIRSTLFEHSAIDAQKYANLLFMGQEKMSFANKSVAKVAGWRVRSLDKVALFPKDLPKICDNTRQMERLSNVILLWESAISRLSRKELIDNLGIVPRPEIRYTLQSAEALTRIGEYLGMKSMIDALYSGVPLEDIIS